MWEAILISTVTCIGSGYAILYGVSEWWKVNEAKTDAAKWAKKNFAVTLVCVGLMAWSFATVHLSSVVTAVTTIQILDAVGVDVSRLTEKQ